MSAFEHVTMDAKVFRDIFASDTELSEMEEDAPHDHVVRAGPDATPQSLDQEDDGTIAERMQLQDTSDPVPVDDAPSDPVTDTNASAIVEPIPPPTHNLLRSSAGLRVLTCRETLNCILSHLGKRTLTRLARTSHDMFLPAADRVWAVLPSFAPLMYLLPARVLSEEVLYPLGNTSIRHRHPVVILKEDLERWKLYAPLVKQITLQGRSILDGVESQSFAGMTEDQANDIAGSILFRASKRLSPGEYLLPNIFQLDILSCIPSLYEPLELLLAPSLYRFTLTLSDRGDAETALSLESLLQSLGDRCPGLAALVLLQGVPEAATQAFKGVWARLPQLIRLHIFPHRGDLTIFGNIADVSQRLSVLTIGDHGYTHDDSDDAQSNNERDDGNSYDARCRYSDGFRDLLKPAHFERLHYLTFRSSFAFAIAFLQACTPKLIRFSLLAQLTSYENDLADLMDTVNLLDKHNTLRHLSFTLGGVASHACWDALYRLRQGSGLLTFEFELESPQPTIKPSDRTLENLTRKWPHLETFIFKIRSAVHRTGISCGGLSAVLQNCPRLRHFRVHTLAKTRKTNLQQLPSDLSFHGNFEPHHFLSRLQVHCLEEVKPVSLAKFLSFTAPHARLKGCKSASQVNQFMQAFADVQRIKDGRDELVIP